MTGAGPRHGAGGSAPGRATPPGRSFALRRATTADAVALARIDTATSTQPWAEATFLTELDHAERAYVVACAGADAGGVQGDGGIAADGEVVGYAGIAFIADDAHVMGIAVLPSAQGRGCGRLLLTALCREAEAADAAMTLEVRPSNGVARHLYRSTGFIEAGRRPGYYPDGEDALILWRDVDDAAAAATNTASAPATASPTDRVTDVPSAGAGPITTLTTDGG